MVFDFNELNPNGDGIGSHWGNQGKDQVNEKCNSKELYDYNHSNKISKQSPINILTDHVQECHTLCSLDINYKPSKCLLERTEQDIIRLKWDSGSYIKFNNNNYELKYIYFHTPSMHTIDNNSSEMELNFYHALDEKNLPNSDLTSQDKNPDHLKFEKDIKEIKDKINKENHAHLNNHNNFNDNSIKGVIISVLVNHSEEHSKNSETKATKPNQFMSQFIHNEKFLNLNTEEMKKIEVHKDWNVKSLLPKKKHFYTYDGSLPMPPCYEEFKWIVFADHIEISEEYIQELRIHGNPKGNRKIHPLNNRLVFFNDNIIMEEKKPIEKKNKNDIVNEILAPIRITVEDRLGIEYRKKANQIINDYTMGEYRNYYDNEDDLKIINKKWEDIGKVGYSIMSAEDIKKTDSGDNRETEEYDKYIEKMVFDYDIDFMEDYLDVFIDNIVLIPRITRINDFKINYTDSDKRKEIGNLMYEINKNNGLFNVDATTQQINYTLDQLKNNLYEIVSQSLSEDGKKKFGLDKSNLIDTTVETCFTTFKNFFNKIDNNNIESFKKRILVLYFLLDWDKNIVNENNQKIRLFDRIELFSDKEGNITQNEIKKIIIDVLNDTNNAINRNSKLKTLNFKIQSNDLNTTVNGYTCQKWGSNQVHYEGSWYDFLSPNLVIPDEGYNWDEIKAHPQSRRLKDMCRDGLLSYTNNRWVPNNNCRNPNNSKSAAWCYTTNPTVRWDYCMKPDLVFHSKRYILLFVFLLLVALSIFTVKLLFRFELFSKFIARLTGSQLNTSTEK